MACSIASTAVLFASQPMDLRLMKTPTLIKITGLLLGLSAVVLLLPAQSEPHIASCNKIISISEQGIERITVQCEQAPQPSWSSWFSGHSSSTQFHFIDLLELLSRYHHKSAS